MEQFEKVCKGLECHAAKGTCGDDCPYTVQSEGGSTCSEPLAADAISLIRAQQERIKELEAQKNKVSQVIIDQIRWERDVAISQLEEIGKGLGSKMDDVVELMKAQQPRVMTLEEVMCCDGAVYVTWQASESGCWAICPPEKDIMAYPEWNTIHFSGGPVNQLEAKYGKTWRCWTSRPTDEQREAVKWDAAD